MRWLVCLLVACSTSPAPPASKGVPLSPLHWRPALVLGAGLVVDSHVHLAYYPIADKLAAHGIGGVVDLASPERALATKYPIPVIHAGPMLTRPGGYPLDAWGSDGYGIGCADIVCVDETIERLQGEGARVIKIALDDDGLEPSLARMAVWFAHKRNMKVAVHALTDAGAKVAADIHADVLAHTPVESLSETTISEWKALAAEATRRDTSLDGMQVYGYDKLDAPAVITTLAAFGGSDAAIDNLRKLRAAGLVVLYGTDLGNLRVDGVSTEETALMQKAGMTDDEIKASMTTVPWHYWGFDAVEPTK